MVKESLACKVFYQQFVSLRHWDLLTRLSYLVSTRSLNNMAAPSKDFLRRTRFHQAFTWDTVLNSSPGFGQLNSRDSCTFLHIGDKQPLKHHQSHVPADSIPGKLKGTCVHQAVRAVASGLLREAGGLPERSGHIRHTAMYLISGPVAGGTPLTSNLYKA